MESIYAGLDRSGLYKGTLLPVVSTDWPLREALTIIDRLDAAILPGSTRKIERSKVLRPGPGWALPLSGRELKS